MSPSGVVDDSPGHGVFPVNGSLGGEPGGPCYQLIIGESPTLLLLLLRRYLRFFRRVYLDYLEVSSSRRRLTRDDTPQVTASSQSGALPSLQPCPLLDVRKPGVTWSALWTLALHLPLHYSCQYVVFPFDVAIVLEFSLLNAAQQQSLRFQYFQDLLVGNEV